MKSKTLLVAAIFSVLLSHSAESQVAIDSLILNGKKQIKESVDSWNIQRLISSRGFFERLVGDTTYPWLIHYYIAYADMRIHIYYFSQNDKGNAEKFVDDGIKHLEKSIELKSDFAEGYALLGSLLGNKIALNPMLGMNLGMKSSANIKKAFDLDPENPRISLIAGESAYYTPKMFGGGKDKAMEHIEKAIAYFKTYKPKAPVMPTWGEDEAYTYSGLIQSDLGELDAAKKSFQHALEINPDNLWVKLNLLPSLEKKIKESDAGEK